VRTLNLTGWREFYDPYTIPRDTWRVNLVISLDFLLSLTSLTRLDLSRGRRVWPWAQLVQHTAAMPALVCVRVHGTDMPAPYKLQFPFLNEVLPLPPPRAPSTYESSKAPASLVFYLNQRSGLQRRPTHKGVENTSTHPQYPSCTTAKTRPPSETLTCCLRR
jgi:hypothetical protein